MQLLTIIGARPQFIKAAAVSRAVAAVPDVSEVLVHTGQHYDANMSRVFFEDLEIPEPDYNLGIGSGSHGRQTGRMLEAIEAVILKEEPDWVLVYGDTNSTLAGALAAVKLHVPVAHVEAGLRSFNRAMPEEINRVLTDHAADLLFAPTEAAVRNLRDEGISAEKIVKTGDVMYDNALFFGKKAEEESRILAGLKLATGEYVLTTIHRAENTDDRDRLKAIFEGLADVAEERPVVLPLHPRTRNALQDAGLFQAAAEALRLIDPVGYLDMAMLEAHANLIVTDSGGVQKEAFFQSVPCVTLRDETEWVELVEAGWNTVCPPVSAEAVSTAISTGLTSSPGDPPDLYGDGKSAKAILSTLMERELEGVPAA